MLALLGAFFAVLATGEYPQAIQGYLVGVYRYGLRIKAYAGPLTGAYPPFRLAA